MPWKPTVPGEIPTLGHYAIDWIAEMLNAPDNAEGDPLILTREQEDFILQWYAIDPTTGRFKYRRGLLGRPRGWGKSPFLAAIALLEGLGEIVPAGWDAEGQPVGRPWSAIRTPLVHIAAVSEKQTRFTWLPLQEMAQGPVQDYYRGVEPMDTFVNLPVGRIEQLTTSPSSAKGGKPVFAVLDQTEAWVPSKRGPYFAQTIRTNAAKIGGRTLESPNAYIPGEGSVAEESAAYAQAILDGRARNDGLLYDHREAPAETDLTDRESLIAGLRFAYGCSSDHPDGCVLHEPPCAPGWAPIESNADMFWDPAMDVQMLRSDFLNQITHASDSYISRPEWVARSIHTIMDADPTLEVKPLTKGDAITLGFDGSRKRKRGVTDATALVACRISDGLTVPLAVWEQPDGPDGEDWRVPTDEVDAAVREAFKTYRVVGFYADPAKWEGHVAQWEARYGSTLKAKASRANPIEWWMTGGRSVLITRAFDNFLNAVLDGDLIHDGGVAFTRHVLNGRRRAKGTGYGVYKEHPDSANKIDILIAAVLAWQARLDAIAAGTTQQRRKRQPRRIY